MIGAMVRHWQGISFAMCSSFSSSSRLHSVCAERERRKLEGEDRRTEGERVGRREEVGGAQKGEDREQTGKELAGEEVGGIKRERIGTEGERVRRRGGGRGIKGEGQGTAGRTGRVQQEGGGEFNTRGREI